MKLKKHGLSIGIERIEDKFYLTLKAIGTLTHEDYETIIPIINSTLNGVKEPKIKALIDCSQLEGWELQAAWDDLKLGLQHGNEFEKIAILKSKEWIKIGAKISSWFMSGEIKSFEDENEAYSWLNE
ncbi:STAS/SEC14 domain-containing protein [Halarcobacter sp.]|uniref:STAS/SEC14 domain-containing protein n=1 Tax=Halarcobacter sp. TaxID=2321133 RepID=UPI002AA81A66|nr:STAS/SEC14 domain-containing protein [Halarcobacter sp.]|eukprot:Anaeramoba_ignava/a478275_65.p2 GENE.a478275_65~~a478275_65.p2  ORF type:complete len:127 (+),score=11.73 a478275_65:140-520(+)